MLIHQTRMRWRLSHGEARSCMRLLLRVLDLQKLSMSLRVFRLLCLSPGLVSSDHRWTGPP